MYYGWTGAGLEVDLSRKKITKTEGDRQMYEKFLTGRGLITKLFWDRVPPETEPFSPNNALIFGVSPLVGTAAPASCKTHLVTRSPLTNYLIDSNTGGFFGPELKFAGYDTLIISGKSATPVYLYINNDKVELRDASHLWGKDVIATQQLLREELRDNDVQTMAIGPAGENRVFFASIEHGPGCSMSRCGAGAVMGDKKLKAIVVRGNRNINIARPLPFFGVCDEIMNRSAFANTRLAARLPDPENGNLYLNIFPLVPVRVYRNFDTPRSWEEVQDAFVDFLAERKALMMSCFNCQQECIHAVQNKEGETFYWKCGIRFMFTNAGDIQDWDYSLRCSSLLQRYGMDSRSGSNACRFGIDLYQKGILTKEDTEGLHLEWGNPEVIPALLEKIAHREGIGDVLANGICQAARQIGRGAEKYAFHFRGLEFSQGDTKVRTVLQSVRKLISDRQGDHRAWTDLRGDESFQGLQDPEEVKKWKSYQGVLRANTTEDMIKATVRKRIADDPEEYDKFFAELTDPEEIKKWKDYLSAPLRDDSELDAELVGKMAAYDAECAVLRDITGICQHRYDNDDNLHKMVSDITLEVGLLSNATGLDLDEEEGMKYARRIRALQHAYNAILGERQNVNELEARLLPKSLLANDRAFLKQLLAETNQRMGYNAEGIPMRDHLEELGLGDVADELERRGISPAHLAI